MVALQMIVFLLVLNHYPVMLDLGILLVTEQLQEPAVIIIASSPHWLWNTGCCLSMRRWKKTNPEIIPTLLISTTG